MPKPIEIRQMQIAREILRSLSRALQFDFCLEGETGWLMLTRVQMSRDLKQARVGFRWVQGNGEIGSTSLQQQVLKKLNERSVMLQRGLAVDLQLRYTPKLEFVFDEAWEQVMQVDQFFYRSQLNGTSRSFTD
ncbi:MAG: ribosome-binding factor A [Bdellovibrionaceae bacterium]|nr:ribosome-binding factor A [Pseudobdellovibrionaceae bacterium]MDW8190435.1 ribosome-binding factor A [Pseudobdellovibrionaceae bacterium]